MNFNALLTNNWRWKLFSLLLAGAAWFYISAGIHGDLGIRRNLGEFVRDFPVARLTAPGDASRYQTEPATVQVTVRGPFLLMQELNWDEFRVFVDLTLAPEPILSAHVVTVTPPRGIQVVAVDPPAVLVRRIGAAGTQPAPAPLSQP